MNPADFMDDEDPKPPKSKRDRVDFARSFEHRRLGYHTRNKFVDSYNVQAVAEDNLVNKEFSDVLCEVPGVPRSTFLMVFSPDGTKVASTHGNHNIYITDIKTGKNIKMLVGHPRTPWCIAFHPTSNQIVASGCLGGQVRIWDLSGGSEVWTVKSQTVIASIAFHPDDRVLVIATYNQLYFWDWSKPEPFMRISTASIKEKVRYVAFDKLGQKLITGIANDTLQSRWVRPPVAIPRLNPESNRFPTPFNRRIITPRIISTPVTPAQPTNFLQEQRDTSTTSVPERERRITVCYRYLLREYEQLVHRYMQICRPPRMVDQGTDPMEPEESTSNRGVQTNTSQNNTETFNPTPSTSGLSHSRSSSVNSNRDQGPSTSRASSYGLSRSNSPLISMQNSLSSSTESIASSMSTETVSAMDPLSHQSTSEASRSSSRDAVGPSTSGYGRYSTSFSRKPATFIQGTQTSDNEVSREPKPFSSKGKHSKGSCRHKRAEKRSRDHKDDPNKGDSSSAKRSHSTSAPVDPAVEEQQNRNNVGLSKIQIQRNRSSSNNSGRMNIFQFSELLMRGSRESNASSREDRPVANGADANVQDSGSGPNYLCKVAIRFDESSEQNNEAPVNGDTETPSVSNESNNQKKLVMNSKFPTNFQPSNSWNGTGASSSSNDLNASNPQTAASDTSLNSSYENNLSDSTSNGTREDNRNGNLPGFRFQGTNIESCARTNMPCSSSRTNYRSGSNYSSGHPRRRFYSHRSAFCPPRVHSRGLPSILRRHTNNSPNSGRRSRYLSSERNNPLFALDEVINYSERHNNEEENANQSGSNAFNPFDPPSDYLSVHPENIGISNMYSNIVQELESSLNDVRNIRPSNRFGETSHMLSTFSERLESIMNQSHAILRNLGTTIDYLTSNSESSNLQSPISTPTELERSPQISFSDRTFYMRDRSDPNESDSVDPNDPVATDHNYPLNPRSSQSGSNSVTPLMASLYLTVSHIQRQARLLRQQVESIERIDGTMLEVAQLQTVRHIFTELQSHFQGQTQPTTTQRSTETVNPAAPVEEPEALPHENRSTSTVNSPPNASSEQSNSSQADNSQNGPNNRGQRPYARCIFLMRTSRNPVSNLMRWKNSRERMIRRQIFRRSAVSRPRSSRNSTESQNNSNERQMPSEASAQIDALPTLTGRLEHYLIEHARLMGISVNPATSSSNTATDVGEYLLALRLNNCRLRMYRLLGNEDGMPSEIRNEHSTATREGRGRYAARQTLVSVIDNLLRFVEANRGGSLTPTLRTHILEVIELSLLLSEILLLQIADSIPPLTGMNLDPERESLSARINQMCSNMLQSRLSGQSQQLTRSLRLMRMTVRHATHALDQTYNARRNAILPMGADRARRVELVQEIHDCLRNIRRRGGLLTAISLNRITQPVRESLRAASRNLSNLVDSIASEEGTRDNQQNSPQQGPSTSEPSSSSGSSSSSRLYRTSNVNLLGCDRLSPILPTRVRPWDVPMVQVNDVPVSDSTYAYPWPSRFDITRQRMERLQELRMIRNGSYFRPRFLHPFYIGNTNNPFDLDVEDQPREQILEGDIVTTVACNHRIQMWKFSTSHIPNISNPHKNVVVSECKIHNDASVDIAADGTMLVTLLPSGGYLNITNRLGVYSLNWESLGQCLYITSLEHNAVSVSLSPLSRHLVVGLATRRISIMPNDRWVMARIFTLDSKDDVSNGRLSAIRQLEKNRDTHYVSVNCIRWLPISGQGLVYATNTGQLRILS